MKACDWDFKGRNQTVATKRDEFDYGDEPRYKAV